MRRSGPPSVLTSALTGQGLHDLTQEQVSLPGSEQEHGSRQTHKSHHKVQRLQHAHADAAHVRELAGRAA